MRILILSLLMIATVIVSPVNSGLAFQGLTAPLRPVHTFSIVARDPTTGQLGVAVQSHWFSVGPIVPWAEAGEVR
jgi:Family of unknown function (DUF1028)